MEIKNVVARLWNALESQCGDGPLPRPFLVMNCEVGCTPLHGFSIVDRDAGRTTVVTVTEFLHGGLEAKSTKACSITAHDHAFGAR